MNNLIQLFRLNFQRLIRHLMMRQLICFNTPILTNQCVTIELKNLVLPPLYSWWLFCVGLADNNRCIVLFHNGFSDCSFLISFNLLLNLNSGRLRTMSKSKQSNPAYCSSSSIINTSIYTICYSWVLIYDFVNIAVIGHFDSIQSIPRIMCRYHILQK